MKKIILFLPVFILLLTLPAAAQNDDEDLVKTYRLDFVIPDLPAFKILGTDPGNLLRPSTPHALAFVVSEFLTSDNGLIPNSFAAEIAPYILFNYNSLTLQDYDRNPVLYSFRISLGTMVDENGNTTNLALGGRITLIDEGDLKNDKEFRQELFVLTEELINLDSLFEAKFLEQSGYLMQDIAADPEKKEEMEDYIKEMKMQYEELVGLSFDERLELIKQEYKARNWNKKKWDLAAATLGQADTSKVKFAQHSVWTTFAAPVSSWGQILFGGNLNFISDDEKYFSVNIASRFYGGINRIKGFAEAQYGYDELKKSSTLLLDLGGEVNILDGVWISFFGGVQYLDLGSGIAKFISHFDIRLSIPEDFNLF